jgi:hypothetical protein
LVSGKKTLLTFPAQRQGAFCFAKFSGPYFLIMSERRAKIFSFLIFSTTARYPST